MEQDKRSKESLILETKHLSRVVSGKHVVEDISIQVERGDVMANVGLIETGLALGAGSKQTVAPYVQSSLQASLIPAIDSLRSLGIVWIPGLMMGMLLSGAKPVYAAIYQFVILSMIFAASGLTSLVSTLLIRSHAFSTAEQLTLGPSIKMSQEERRGWPRREGYCLALAGFKGVQ